MVHSLCPIANGGKVEPAGTREYGRAHLASFDSKENVLFKGVSENTPGVDEPRRHDYRHPR